jgi:glycosyltransferase involved in cell wall biosynthesis
MYPTQAVLNWHRVTKKPFLISVHGMLSPVSLGYSSGKKQLARVMFEDRAFRHATVLHATSEREIVEIRKFGLDKPIALIPNGVTSIARPLGLKARDGRFVLSLGRIHPKKGLDRLLKAWRLLEFNFPDWYLEIVGPEEVGHGDYLRDLIVQFELQRAYIRGPQYGDNKVACLANAELFVLPTLNENFGLTVAESLMLEVPVVSTTGAPWERLDHFGCGRWVDHGEIAIANALREMMSMSPENLREMGQRGREWMLSEYSWESVARRSLKCYRYILGVGPAPEDLRLSREAIMDGYSSSLRGSSAT